MTMKNDTPGSDNQITCIGPGAKIVGELHGSLEVLIDGRVEGQLKGESEVIVGPSGSVKGSIEASTIRIRGRVVGDVSARERVELVGDGHLEGEIFAPNLIIEPGAFFKGKVDVEGADVGSAVKDSSK